MEREALVYMDFADGPVMVGLCRREATRVRPGEASVSV
jgi:hypothetical protein